MKKYIYMAVAAIAALSSCSSDNDVIMEETAKQPLKFTASMEGATTRATFDSENKCASWEVNDKILIMANTQTSFYSYNAEAEGLTTTFIPYNPSYVVDPDATNYEAYFGCEILYGTPQKPCIPWTLYETWVEGKFNMPMYATSTTHDFQFKNLCGVLKIKVTNEQIAAVKSIKLSSANKAIAGSFTVDANNAAVLDDPDVITNARTIIYNSAVPTTAEGTVFYVAVPAQTYQELNISLNDGNGSILNMTTKAATDITVERNKIYPITFKATSYAASFEVGDPRRGETAFSGFESSTLTASNADVSVSLALTGDRGMDPEWNERGDIMAMEDSKLTITVTPETGVTVSGIEYLYSYGNKKVTKTGAGPWQFDVKNNKVYDGSTELHSTYSGGCYGIVVNYKK